MTSIQKTFLLAFIAVLAAVVVTVFVVQRDDVTGSGTVVEGDSHAGRNHAPGEHPGPGQGTNDRRGIGEQAATITDWCADHTVPESQCTKCHPDLIEHFRESGDWCTPHELPESHCRLCNPDILFPQEELLRAESMKLVEDEIEIALFFRPNSEVCATDGALIQFASAETAKRTGITVRSVREGAHQNQMKAPAEVVFDEGSASVITSSVDALVSRWLVSPGDIVRRGDLLAVLTSPEVAELQAELLSSNAEYELQNRELERHRELLERELISQSEYDRQASLTQRSKADFVSARGLLRAAGMSEGDIERVVTEDQISSEFALRSQADGIVVERIAPLGKLKDAGEAFAMLANPRSMWIEAQLTEEQLRFVGVGQDLTFASDGRGLSRVGAKVIWVSHQLDSHTRTGTVRAEVVDPSHSLQAGELGTAVFTQEAPGEVVLVPRDAVQWEGCCNVVFVKENDDRYRPRKVELAGSEGSYYQVLSGLRSGEQVVIGGAFLLKTELKKSSIGAGCCGLEPTG